MRSFLASNGLLNSKVIPNGGQDENAPLFSMHYILLHDGTSPEAIEMSSAMLEYTKSCYIKDGLYHQRPDNNGSKEDWMSPDQLISFVALFNQRELPHKNRMIWRWLLLHWFTYDNMSMKTNFKRIMQPAAVAFVGASAGFISKPFWRFILMFVCIIACFSEPGETSGKLKA